MASPTPTLPAALLDSFLSLSPQLRLRWYMCIIVSLSSLNYPEVIPQVYKHFDTTLLSQLDAKERLSAARSAQARKYTESGLAARAKGDMVAAANGFRVALSFDPESTELKAMHAEAQRAADEILVEQYLKQAEYEERSERWADAGRSWARVARTQTSNAKAHERAAFCLLKAGGDLHEAAALGQRGVQLEPKNAAFRRTMANVYLGAGLTLNAKRELDAALQLAPDEPTTIALLKRIAKSM